MSRRWPFYWVDDHRSEQGWAVFYTNKDGYFTLVCFKATRHEARDHARALNLELRILAAMREVRS